MDQSVSQLFQHYLERSKLAPHSIRFKRRALGYFLEWFGDPEPTAVDVETAERYQMRLFHEQE